MHDAFLSAIIEAPDDDLPRLAYADWLDENGDPARAEFIRTEIELARTLEDDPRWEQLRDRAHEIRCEYARKWYGDLLGSLESYDTKRGLLEFVSLNAAA